MKNQFHRYILFAVSVGAFFRASAGDGLQLNISGSPYNPIEITPEKSTGLDNIYVLYSIGGVSLSFEASSAADISIHSYSKGGAAYGNPISFTRENDGIISFKPLPESSTGYAVTINGVSHYFWLIDYSKYRFSIDDIYASNSVNCDTSIIDFTGEASPIVGYTITGKLFHISRDISLQYRTQEYDESSNCFTEICVKKTLPSITENIAVFPPIYCDTEIYVSGDRFLKEWQDKTLYATASFTASAVVLKTYAMQFEDNENDDRKTPQNEVNNSGDRLGGSAPAVIRFKADTSDAVMHTEWQISRTPEFDVMDYRISQDDLEFTFTEEGEYYVRCVASNADGSCEAISETYEVSIGSSLLKIPNAFTPDGDGVNDEWKVTYRSLIDFQCKIFDRQGHEVFRFDNPAYGWDGTRGGKSVKPGVYFYVISATGADGKRYNKSGDINILSVVNRQQTQE